MKPGETGDYRDKSDRTSEHRGASNGMRMWAAFRAAEVAEKPGIELTRMNRAETAEAVFVLAHRIKISKGVRKIPPPVPVNPESSPSPAPRKWLSVLKVP